MSPRKSGAAALSHRKASLPRREAGGDLRKAVLVEDNLEKPSLDNRSYRVIRLGNDLEALLVHDPETDKASAAMDVNVGNFSDANDMPGMAHAVEHLLFMGTKTFPAENEYAQYLSSHSGTSNAYTAATSTNFFFEVAAKAADDDQSSDAAPSPLYGALDRFSRFFIEPLFLSSTLDRELRAVDSENKKNRQNDTWRMYQLDKFLSNSKHPYCHFSTGNLEVLKTLPEARGVNVRDAFMEFHAKHYSSNLMKLVILGREPLDTLQTWTVDLFSGIPNKKLPPNRWDTEVPLRKSDLASLIFAKPVMDSRELNLRIPILDEEDLYETLPSRYISHLIGHEGPGSIMSYIKNKGWATSLSAGAISVCPGTPGHFDCQIRLTEEGLKNYREIVKVFFQYVSLLREEPPQEWIFREQKDMTDVDFKFKQKIPAMRFTSKISVMMQKPLPRAWLLSGQSVLREFAPDLIVKSLDCFTPDNLRITIVSRTFPGDWDKKEPWYGTEYRIGKIDPGFMEELWEAVKVTRKDRLPALHLPHQNNFVPTELEVEKREVKEPALSPKLVRNDATARAWWKKDDTFWVPRANVLVSCKIPIMYASAENVVKVRLYTDLVRDALEEYSYDAEISGLQYQVGLDSRGLLLDLSGYNDKLAVLLEQVLMTMRDLEIKDERFDIVKERLKRGYHNWELQSSYQQVEEYTNWLNSERDFLVEERAAELPNITAESTRQFHQQMLSQFHIEVYVHGNLHKQDALQLTHMVESTLRPRVLPRSQWPIIRSLILPQGSNYVYEKTLKDPGNVNHCIEYWLYLGSRSDRVVRAQTLILDQMIHEPAFDQLRTKEQLGYVVFSGVRAFSTTYGFRFMIQSEKPPAYLEGRVESFLEGFAETIAAMSEAEFEGHKRSVIVRRLEKLKNLDQETNRHWAQIHNNYYDFELAQQDAAHVKQVTKAEILELWNRSLLPTSKTRSKLSVHLYALGSLESDAEAMKLFEELDLSEGDSYLLKAGLLESGKRRDLDCFKKYLAGELPGLSSNQVAKIVAFAKESIPAAKSNGVRGSSASGSAPTVITDVRQFKAGLLVSPGARPARDLSEFEEIDAKL